MQCIIPSQLFPSFRRREPALPFDQQHCPCQSYLHAGTWLVCLSDLNSGSPGWSCAKPGSSDGLALCSARNLVHVSPFWFNSKAMEGTIKAGCHLSNDKRSASGRNSCWRPKDLFVRVSSAVSYILYLSLLQKSLNQSFNSLKYPVASAFSLKIIASCRRVTTNRQDGRRTEANAGEYDHDAGL